MSGNVSLTKPSWKRNIFALVDERGAGRNLEIGSFSFIFREIFLSIDINSVAPRGYVCNDPRYRSFLTLDVASFPLAILFANFLIGNWWAMQIPIFARREEGAFDAYLCSTTKLPFPWKWRCVLTAIRSASAISYLAVCRHVAMV
ncbi:hypothetical protein ALC53_00164 [Atta colombica]|uniref:Uncharacterized protein n=1 Tax=Atta colombica TaxID=520822 RepID=A0A195BZ82_9HYME|nr:hypothetical protein ALC53_00164 [Atta colombica]